MPTFRCEVIGNNFVLLTDDGPHRMAFYGNRDIEADRPEEAERQAVEQIWLELSPRVLNQPEDPPNVTVERVGLLRMGDKTAQAFTWISENQDMSS